MDDKLLKKMVEEELTWEPSVDAADVGVSVEKGIVRLTGHVGSYPQKIAAEAAVKRVKNVRGFVDDLEVRYFDTGDNDEAIAARVANVLDWDISVPKGAVKVQVQKGMVTLIGQVDWQYQRLAAEQGLRSLRGVRGVFNNIQLKPHVQASDIKRRIEDALERQADIEAKQILVSVEGNKVRLDGKIKAWGERDIIERAAWSAPGVGKVEDHLSMSW